MLSGVPDRDMAAMELGLAHSLSRYKLKFSPDKVDTMIVQVSLFLISCDSSLKSLRVSSYFYIFGRWVIPG